MLVANDLALVFSDRLSYGVQIAEVPLGGLSRAEAEKRIRDDLQQRQSEPLITLTYGEKKWGISWDAVQEKPDPAILVSRAYEVGRTGTLIERLQSQFLARTGGKTISYGLKPELTVIRSQLDRMASSLDREALDASVRETSSGLQIQQDVKGLRVDKAASLLKVAQALTTGAPKSLPLTVEEFKARIQTADLQGINSLLATYATEFDGDEVDRNHNIQLAAGKLNGMLIRSKDIFSFNEKVGPRSLESGYRKALSLTSSGMVMDWGGGVCQVSSTFYNAALLAGLEVLERSAHFQPPAYVPVGLDATVADGQIDLKLKNNSPHAVYVKTRMAEGRIESRIYGHKENPDFLIRVEVTEKQVQTPRTVVLQDPSLPLGSEWVEHEGKPGFTVTVHRIISQKNQDVRREMISTDEFEGSPRILRVGSRQPGQTDHK